MKNHVITIRTNGAPALVVKGRVENVKDLGRLFRKAQSSINGTERFLRGYAQTKVYSVTVRVE